MSRALCTLADIWGSNMQALSQLFQKTYEFPISREYVKHWGFLQAVREILQNGLDSDSPFEYEFVPVDTGFNLRITSRYSRLEANTLLLGATSKADATDKIGSFGEGYKIALLVLAREGYAVTVYNRGVEWVPGFHHKKQFDAEVFCITETAAAQRHEGVTFEIRGISPDEKEQIVESCLRMQRDIGEIITVPQGEILKDRQGMLYVGGLFVCKTDMTYGYSVKPQFLTLERDRQTVSGFDLKFLVKEMWFAANRPEELAQMIADKVPDAEYAHYSAPEIIKEACYKHFVAKNPGVIAVTTQEELKQVVEQGMKVEVVRENYGTLIRASAAYRSAPMFVPKPVENPHDILTSFLQRNERHMQRWAYMELKQIVDGAKDWKMKSSDLF